jgi:hypothetical protein
MTVTLRRGSAAGREMALHDMIRRDAAREGEAELCLPGRLEQPGIEQVGAFVSRRHETGTEQNQRYVAPRRPGAQRARQCHAVHFWHMHVGDDHIGQPAGPHRLCRILYDAARQPCECVAARIRTGHLHAPEFQLPSQDAHIRRMIVDNQRATAPQHARA